MRALRLSFFLLPLGYALACGGRTSIGGNDGDGSGGSVTLTPAGTAGSASTQTTGGECADQRRLYVDYRRNLVQENVDRGCSVNQDCSIFEDTTGCSPTCAFALPVASRRGVADRLYRLAETSCLPVCPDAPIPPCDPRPEASCVMGRCL